MSQIHQKKLKIKCINF